MTPITSDHSFLPDSGRQAFPFSVPRVDESKHLPQTAVHLNARRTVNLQLDLLLELDY